MLLILLSLLLPDAASERLIPANRIRAQRRGRRRAERRSERLWATPAQVLAIADNAALLPHAGPAAAVLIVTAAWTGARWGELAGLQRANTHLDPDTGTGCVVIDPRVGSLVESSRGAELGPPKTAESARTITLPPFLVGLLRRHPDSHRHRFCSPPPPDSRIAAAASGRGGDDGDRQTAVAAHAGGLGAAARSDLGPDCGQRRDESSRGRHLGRDRRSTRRDPTNRSSTLPRRQRA